MAAGGKEKTTWPFFWALTWLGKQVMHRVCIFKELSFWMWGFAPLCKLNMATWLLWG
jgi:hypothetical protein